MTDPDEDGFDTAAERERIADWIAEGAFRGVVLVDRPDPDPNAEHGANTPDEMDGA